MVAFVGGLGAIILALCRRSQAGFALAQTAYLTFVFMGLAGEAGHVLDARISSHFAAQRYRELRLDNSAPNDIPGGPFTYQLPRAYQYSLNFYFHRELSVWPEDSTKGAVIFTSPRVYHERLAPIDCFGATLFTAVIPCQSKPSLDRPAGGRQPQ